MERQPSEWKTITANETTDKESSAEIYKQFMQLNTRKINDPMEKEEKEIGQRTKQTFLQRHTDG